MVVLWYNVALRCGVYIICCYSWYVRVYDAVRYRGFTVMVMLLYRTRELLVMKREV